MALAVSLPVAILLSLLVGFFLGALVTGLLVLQHCKKSLTNPEQHPPPSIPVYEEVAHERGVSLEMKTNEAYGHIQSPN